MLTIFMLSVKMALLMSIIISNFKHPQINRSLPGSFPTTFSIYLFPPCY